MYAVLILHPLLCSCNFLLAFFGKKEVKELLVLWINKTVDPKNHCAIMQLCDISVSYTSEHLDDTKEVY